MRTKDSPTYLTTSIAKLIALGIAEDAPINIRRLDIQEYVANNLEKLLTVAPKADTVDEETEATEQVKEFQFDN